METKLTEKEFDVIIEALEQLPSRSKDGDLVRKLMLSMICKDDEDSKQKAMDELAIKELQEEAERKECKKKCGIITGKLYMMKDNIVEG